MICTDTLFLVYVLGFLSFFSEYLLTFFFKQYFISPILKMHNFKVHHIDQDTIIWKGINKPLLCLSGPERC